MSSTIDRLHQTAELLVLPIFVERRMTVQEARLAHQQARAEAAKLVLAEGVDFGGVPWAIGACFICLN